MLSSERFSELFSLQPDTIKPFMQKGEWAIHDVLPVLLAQYGPANVSIATFSISEDSVRALFLESNKGNILSLSLLLDFSVRKNKLEQLLFANEFSTTIHLNDVHAKILLIENDKIQFGIVGSANLNRNRRIESGFYFTSGNNFDYFKNEVEKYIENSVPYEIL